MLTLDFKSDIANTLKKLNTLQDAQLPNIVAHAMNKTMSTVRSKEKQRIGEVFSNPTPYAVNSPYTIPATADRLEVSMSLRRFGGKGVPAERFMSPEIEGGHRSYKAHEKALSAAGILPAGLFCVPSEKAGSLGLLDQYGNMSGAYINSMLSYLQANRDSTQNRKTGTQQARQFFAVSQANARGLPLGIYQRVGQSFHLVMAFVKDPTYKKRYDYFETAQNIIDRFFISDLTAAADQAVERGDTLFSGEDFAAILRL
jgi:hypothetical protein